MMCHVSYRLNTDAPQASQLFSKKEFKRLACTTFYAILRSVEALNEAIATAPLSKFTLLRHVIIVK